MTNSDDSGKERPGYLKALEEIEDRRKRIDEGLEEDEWADFGSLSGRELSPEEKEAFARRHWAQDGPPGCDPLDSAIYIYPRPDLIRDFQEAVKEGMHVDQRGIGVGGINWTEREKLFEGILRREVREAVKGEDCSVWGLPRNDPDPKYIQVSRLVIDRVTIGWDDNTVIGLGHDLLDCKVCARGVTPNDEYSPSVSRKATKVTSIRQCKKWLIDLMAAGEKEHPKRWYLREAKARFKISDNNFKVVWKEACQESGNASWSRGGRPKNHVKINRVSN